MRKPGVGAGATSCRWRKRPGGAPALTRCVGVNRFFPDLAIANPTRLMDLGELHRELQAGPAGREEGRAAWRADFRKLTEDVALGSPERRFERPLGTLCE